MAVANAACHAHFSVDLGPRTTVEGSCPNPDCRTFLEITKNNEPLPFLTFLVSWRYPSVAVLCGEKGRTSAVRFVA